MVEPHKQSFSLEYITDSFNEVFNQFGYVQEKAVKITDKIDSTVRFVGAPISVMKPYLVGKQLPNPGVHMIQPCVRTQNITEMFEPLTTPTYGSYFIAMGALALSTHLDELFKETSRFMADTIGLNSDNTFISTYSEDTDLKSAAEDNGYFEVRCDVMQPDYYRHVYGMEGVWGHNTSYWVRNSLTGEYEDIGNIISINNRLGTMGVELALGDSTLLKQVSGLEHVLDSYDLQVIDQSVPSPIKRRLQDCIITGMALWGEGLLPSARDNQSRLLRSYFKGISLYRRLSDINMVKLKDSIDALESDRLPFNASGAANYITNWINEYESSLYTNGPSNHEDNKIMSLLN